MATVKQNAVNLDVTINATGFLAKGGTTQKGITVEDDSIVNQDLTTDKTGVAFGSVILGGVGATVNEFSTDGTMVGNSAVAVPTESAVVTYVGTSVGAAAMTTSVITADQAAAVGNRYGCNKTAGGAPLALTLPATAAVGNQIAVVGMGSEGWKITAAAGDTIQFGSVSTKTGGYISSVSQYDCLHIICTVADSSWEVIDSIGNMTVEIS